MFNYFLLTISLLSFLAGCSYAIRKNAFTKAGVIFISVIATFLLCYSAFFLVSDYFTNNGIDDSVFYHLRYGLSGSGFGEYWFLILLTAIFAAFSVAVPYKLLNSISIGGIDSKKKRHRLIVYSCILCSFIISPTTYGIIKYSHSSYTSLFSQVNARNDFHEFYRTPYINKAAQRPFNLVYIYAESLERTYFDESVFPGLIKYIREHESNGITFTQIEQVAGTAWTIAGMTASLCGIPLVTPSHDNSMSGMDSFLANASCLGDLLAEQKYNLSYLGGASIEFAGKGKFFFTHGFDEVLGRDQLIELLPDKSYQTGWGLYDDTLFDAAIDKFNSLSRKEQPFGLFLLTLDTHHPNGHPSKRCSGKEYLDGENPILNAVACSDYLIGDFITRIFASEYGKNTIVILSSDHLAMRNTATSMLNKLERKNLFLVLSPNNIEPLTVNKRGSMLDVAPTILSVMGYEGEVGLGRNLLADEIPLVSHIDEFDNALRGWHSSLMNFWGFPKIASDDLIEINNINKTVAVQNRTFKYPLLIEFGNDNQTIIRFKLHRKRVKLKKQRLVDYMSGMTSNKPFLWVDSCKDIRPVITGLRDSYCVLYGKAGTTSNVFYSIQEDAIIPVKNILSVN
jgi:phosphoglycerol transferase